LRISVNILRRRVQKIYGVRHTPPRQGRSPDDY
jgi:hypothetical protein